VKLETDIDDCSGEVLGYVMKKLFKAGAKDVHYAPVFMKKNRPAWELTVICGEDKAEELEQIIFTESLAPIIDTTKVWQGSIAPELNFKTEKDNFFQVKNNANVSILLSN